MPSARLQDCTDDAVALVRRWTAASAGVKPDPRAVRLTEALRDEHGLDFTRGFLDRVIRPEDPRVAARILEKTSQDVPDALAWYLRGAVALGGGFASMAPWAAIPTVRRILRRMAGHLVVDATPAKLGAALAKTAGPGTTLDLVPLGDAVLGSAESDRRLQATLDLLGRDDVDHVTLSIADVVPQRSPWAFDRTVDRAVDRLVPLARAALLRRRDGGASKGITLDVAGYRDLAVTVAVFRTLLDRDEFAALDAGVTLPTAVPDAADALDALTTWAQGRRARGGAPVRVRLTKGGDLAAERVEAILHEWPLATWDDERDVDAAHLRLLDAALTPERTDAVRVGVVGRDLFDLAAAWTLAQRRGVTGAVDVEVLLGTASSHLDAVRADVGRIRVLTPVVHPDHFDAAIPWLARRLQDAADADRSVATDADRTVVAEPGRDADPVALREGRWRAAVDALDAPVPATLRTQDRTAPVGSPCSATPTGRPRTPIRRSPRTGPGRPTCSAGSRGPSSAPRPSPARR